MHYQNYLTLANLEIAALLLLGGLIASILVGVLKHGLPSLEERKKLSTAIAGVFGLIATLSGWAITASSLTPRLFIGKYAGWVIAAAFFAHRFLVSPFYTTVIEGWLNDAKAGKALRQVEVTPVVVQPPLPVVDNSKDFTLN